MHGTARSIGQTRFDVATHLSTGALRAPASRGRCNLRAMLALMLRVVAGLAVSRDVFV